MRFWDSSAVVPLVISEPTTGTMIAMLADDREIALSWFTSVEVTSAICRRWRETGDDVTKRNSDELIDALLRKALEIRDIRSVALHARVILERHALKAADALQLASALVLQATEDQPLPFVTLDHRLADAARAEGLTVITSTPR